MSKVVGRPEARGALGDPPERMLLILRRYGGIVASERLQMHD